MRRSVVRGVVADGAYFMRPVRQIRGDDMTRGQIVDFFFKVIPFCLKRFNGGFKRGSGHDGRGFVVAGAQTGRRLFKVMRGLFRSELRRAFNIRRGVTCIKRFKREIAVVINDMTFQVNSPFAIGAYPRADVGVKSGLSEKIKRYFATMTVRTFREDSYGNH